MQSDETFVRMLAATSEAQQPKLYEAYHENTKLHPLLEARNDPTANPNAALNQATTQVAIAEIESTVATGGKKYRAAPRQVLTHSLDAVQKATFLETLSQRESIRAYQAQSLTLDELAVLCKLSYGWNNKRDEEVDGAIVSFRFVPSAGRLYPLELYLVTPATESRGVEECDLWHYEPNTHILEYLYRAKVADIRAAFVQFPATMPSVVAFLTGVIPRLTWKYGDRAYRYALLEAGHVGQNLILAATALNLVSCPIVSFYDDVVHNLLDADGISEVVLYSFFIGHPDIQ